MVIDLGEVRHAPEAAELPSSLPRVRRGFAALGAAAALLAAGGAVPVRGHLVEVILPVSASYAFARGDAVYAADNETIVRYELPEGRERWRVTVPAIGRSQRAFTLGEMVLIASEGPESETVALAGAPAERRWRRPGTPSYTDDDKVLLSQQRPGDPAVRYEMVDVATGAVRWDLTSPYGEPMFFDDDRFVRWSPTGHVEVRDLRTGRVWATGAVPPPDADAVPPDRGLGVQVVGDLLLVARWRAGEAMADAYDLKTFARRWTADLDLSSEFPAECGDVLCVNRQVLGGGMRALAWDTGRFRWSNDQLGGAHGLGPVLLGYGLSADLPRIMIVNPEDGRLRADLGPWELGWPYLDDRRALAIRSNARGGTWVAELDLVAGTRRILGLARDAFGCRASARVVVCRQSGGTTGIWYPRRRLDE